MLLPFDASLPASPALTSKYVAHNTVLTPPSTFPHEVCYNVKTLQQIQNDASREAEAHVDAASKAREAARTLEKKLSDAKQECTHHAMRV